MNTATIKFDSFESLKNEDCQDRIIKAKKTLGDKIVILGHHYQNTIALLTLKIVPFNCGNAYYRYY